MKLLLGLMTASATACLIAAPLANAHETDKDKGPRVEESYDFKNFTGIIVSGVYEVEIEVGGDYAIDLSGSEKRMKHVEVTKSGDKLYLGTDNSRVQWKGKNNGILAKITLPALDEVSLTGVGSIEANGINAKTFVSDVEGVGSVELSGRCTTLKASVEGVGSLEATRLKCESVDVSVEGVGSAEVYASESVVADVDGVGSIDVIGSPEKVKKSKSIMSSISVR